MKVIHWFLGVLAAVAMVIVLFITSFEIACYSDFGWYQITYEKYDVESDMEMKMEDIMNVTREMMKYLRGDREDLVVHTTIAGEEREFFNDREKAHMVDVKRLFIGGIWLRTGALCVAAVCVLVLILIKAEWKKILPKSFIYGTVCFMGALAVLAMLCVSDFTKYFTIFHLIFFDNDLWLLDPYTDWLIRMLPEGFFMDMVIRIGMIFVILLASVLGFSVLGIKKQKHKENL